MLEVTACTLTGVRKYGMALGDWFRHGRERASLNEAGIIVSKKRTVNN